MVKYSANHANIVIIWNVPAKKYFLYPWLILKMNGSMLGQIKFFNLASDLSFR